ncbi:MAG: hypothetical protein CUN56_16075, partial [Phototrophicales bacterium]
NYKDGVDFSRGSGAYPEEAGGIRAFVQEFVDHIRAKGGRWAEIEIMVTETGYAINRGSPQHCPIYGSWSDQHAQALGVVRMYLAYSAVNGLTAINQFFFSDTHSDALNDPSLWASTGLLSGGYTYDPPHISWYWHKQMHDILEGTSFES